MSRPTSWVVYRMTLHGKPTGMSAVCEQGEWDAMERQRPGYHTLLRAGIASESEADRVARATAAAPSSPPARGTGLGRDR